jgi:hypothetical protein
MSPARLVNTLKRRKRLPHPELYNPSLPLQRAPLPAGVMPRGGGRPTLHEMALLRRLEAAGGWLQVTLREGSDPFYTYASGIEITNERHQPLTKQEFARLVRFLDPIANEALFDFGPPQRYAVRKPPMVQP